MPVKGRGAHEGTIRQRKPGLWEARIRNGNERESIYGKTEQEVIEKLLEARKAVSEGRPLPNRRMTVAQLIHDWLEAKRPPATAPKTWRGYEEKCRNHIVPAWGTTKIRELRPGQVESYLNQKVRDGQLSPMSARHIRGILRAALNWAMAEGHVSRNVAALAKTPKVPRRDVEPFTPEEVDAILSAVAGDRLEALYLTEIALGLRPEELVGITWPNVDLDRAVLHVRNTVQYVDGEYLFVPATKTLESQAAMPLPSFVVQALEDHLERQDKEKDKLEKHHATWGNEWDLVFTTEDGRPLHDSTIYHHFQKLLRRIGFRPRSFYTLRHTSASLLIEDGAELRDVLEHLRHSQISLTANTYTHLYQSRKRATADRMDARLRNSRKQQPAPSG